MFCHRIPEVENMKQILGTLPSDQIERALENVASFKEKLVPANKFSEGTFHKIDDEIWELRVAVLGDERARQISPQSVQHSPVELF
jgi:hypothetical protein